MFALVSAKCLGGSLFSGHTVYVVHDIGRMIIVMSQVWLVYVITSQMYFIARDVCCVVYAAAAAAAAAAADDDDDDGDDDDDDVGT